MAHLWVVPEELEETADSPYAYEACKAASFVLWAFSGRKYHGTRTVTERYELPCRSGLGTGINVYPILNGSGGVENRYIGRLDSCGCAGTIGGRHTRLRLRGTPVRAVTQVSKNGTVLDPESYKIVNGSLLQLNGSQDVDGLEITYTYGVPVPIAGQRAARALARELAKGWAGDAECALPDRVTNVSRQGISFTVMDPQDFLDDGRTGVYEVDLFLRAANPDKARNRAKVFSPDKPKAYRVTSATSLQLLGPLDWQITPGMPATWTVDLAANGGDILLQNGWTPQGQITSWNGTTLLEFDSSRFSITGNTLTVTLTEEETADIPGSNALWDLYGLNDDGYTIIHVLDSKILKAGTN